MANFFKPRMQLSISIEEFSLHMLQMAFDGLSHIVLRLFPKQQSILLFAALLFLFVNLFVITLSSRLPFPNIYPLWSRL